MGGESARRGTFEQRKEKAIKRREEEERLEEKYQERFVPVCSPASSPITMTPINHYDEERL